MSTTITADSQIAELVTERPSRGRVFEKYKIDYCCGGKIPVSEACEKLDISTEQMLNELHEHDAATTNADQVTPSWNDAKLGDLIDHIIAKHHDHLREELPRLLTKVERVAAVHGDNHPETVELVSVYRGLKDELLEHITKEEDVLFPWIRGLEKGEGQAPFPGMKMNQPINCMEHDHEKAGDALDKIQTLTNNYTPPADACNTYRVLYEGLRDLQVDIHEHVHKENHILFPKALELDK